VRLLDGASDVPVSADHDRCVDPGQTLDTLRPRFPDLGITRLGEITGLDILGIPVAFAARPNSFTLSVSLGKGLDRISAYASAAMEAAETALAERLPARRVRASVRDLEHRGETTIDLARLARCQPHRLSSSVEIDWVEGHDLMAGTKVLVPWGLVGFDHRSQAEGFHDAFEVSSDGLASGNTTAEAVLHGIYELIERDGYALIELLPEHCFRERLRDPSSVVDGTIERMLGSIGKAGLRLELAEMTTDISVPSFLAILEETRINPAGAASPSPSYAGCGCHSSPRRAIRRALTEAVQARLAFIAGARDDLEHWYYGRAPSPGPVDPGAAIAAGTLDRQAGITIGDRIDELLSKLSAAGIDQVVAVEICATFGLSVVRVLVSDLQIPLHGTRTQVTRRGLQQFLKYSS
jgi:ribosomal protein S12 methylthiotransferase accessory factor